MDVVGDDRHVDLAVVARGRRVVAAVVDRETEIRRELVVEQLDALALGRMNRRHAGILRVVLDCEARPLDRGDGLHAERDVVDDGAFRAAVRLALAQ